METKKMKVKTCPECGSSEIDLYMGGQFGKYVCKKCGYIGPLVVEKEIGKPSKP